MVNNSTNIYKTETKSPVTFTQKKDNDICRWKSKSWLWYAHKCCGVDRL